MVGDPVSNSLRYLMVRLSHMLEAYNFLYCVLDLVCLYIRLQCSHGLCRNQKLPSAPGCAPDTGLVWTGTAVATGENLHLKQLHMSSCIHSPVGELRPLVASGLCALHGRLLKTDSIKRMIAPARVLAVP